jgi:hypothetical protein
MLKSDVFLKKGKNLMAENNILDNWLGNSKKFWYCLVQVHTTEALANFLKGYMSMWQR